ncbi:MAG: glucose 1-dehydrogenase [bacterium]|nr:short-chain dehydrogenase [Deltaproteobacteria bacterium]MCP4907140.1 glucose 1-dehydrogenase [bacterium]
MTSGRVTGKVAIITGGASGIGRITAETLAREGARVVIADINVEGGQAVAEEIRGKGGEALAIPVDVGEEKEIAAMVERTVETFGALHVLHNNAAITAPDHQRRDANLLELDTEIWDETMRIDLRGPMLACKHAIPRMIESGGGSIINTTSNSALAGDLTLNAYSAAKGGLNTLTLSVATAFGKEGIRCNAVSPAHIESPSLAAVVPPEVVEMLRAQCLTPRLGAPQDVANLVLYLASDEASFITGQILRCDGGALSHLAHVAQLRDSDRTTNRTDEV